MKKHKHNNCNCETPKDNNCTCNSDCHCHDENGKDLNCESKKDEKCTCGDNCNCHENGEKCTCGCDEECHCQDEEITKLNEKIKGLEDALLRSHAELQNYRKRKDEDTARIIKYAEEDILKGFLPILDNFERAINMDDNNFGDETSKFLEGFRMVYNQTKSLLEKFEVKEIDCLGKEFDPTYEQAVSTTKRTDKKPGIVTEVYQKGYTYKDKVLRTAMVIVSE